MSFTQPILSNTNCNHSHFRSSRRNVFLGLLMVTLLAAVIPTRAMAQTSSAVMTPGTPYLALGDSLAFGYNALIQPPDISQYVGYPTLVSQGTQTTLVNASCPGETSATFIGSSTQYFPGFDCAALIAGNGLFVPYDGARFQQAYAVNFLRAHPETSLITINIGGNDLALLQVNCQAAYPNNQLSATVCQLIGLTNVLSSVNRNLTSIYSQIRATGYRGKIVALNYYTFNYRDALQTSGFASLNTSIALAGIPFGVQVADEFTAFLKASAPFQGDACAAGLLVRLANGACDTHPSPKGRLLLANTILSAIGAPVLPQ